MIYTSQNPIRKDTVITLGNHGPPSSARPHALLVLRMKSNIIAKTASPENNKTLKPKVPAGTMNGSSYHA